MRLTRATNYAVRALAAIGEKGTLARSDLPTLAREMGAPSAFLGKVLQRLGRAGIVESVRGARGGYGLARPAEEITVREVVEAVEGRVTLASCVESPGGAGSRKRCPRERRCRARPLWSRLQRRLNAALESETIAGLAGKGASPRGGRG